MAIISKHYAGPMFVAVAALLLILILPATSLAVFCPDCGTRNSEEFKYCVKCGRGLAEVRSYLENSGSGAVSAKGAAPDAADTAGPASASPSAGGNVQGGEEIEFLNKSGFSDLMKNPGNSMRAMELMDTLRKEPASMSLFERYKDSGYQNQLLEGLKSVNEAGDPDMDANIKSLEGLFQLLNGMGNGGGQGDSTGIESLFGGSGSGGPDESVDTGSDDTRESPGDDESGWGFDGK